MTEPQVAAKIAAATDTAPRVFVDVAVALAEGDFTAVDIMLPHHLHLPVTEQCFVRQC